MSTNLPTSPIEPGELSKQYRPSEHEKRVWDRWIAAKAFHADPTRVVRGEAKPYSILIPPPNVTAALHLGHALNNTLQDILARVHRMRGFETMWMPGTDHAGIATQAVVEKRLRKEGQLKGALRTSMQREEFVAHVQAFKDEYEGTITGQLKAMGCSCDWDRQRFTMDETCARAVREAFFRLFKEGLIYRGKRLVNWDPALQTAVADDECYDEEIDGAFYYLRYPLVRKKALGSGPGPMGEGQPEVEPVTWDELSSRGYPGASQHPADAPAWITVATTRPETYLGDVAVAINPHDPRAKALRGLMCELPIVGRVIPILEDDYVVLPERYARSDEEKNDPKAKMATGFLKVTPAHDQNDYELGQRHTATIEALGNPVLINVMAPDGSISDKHGWTDVNGAHIFVGKKREDARKLVIQEFKARTVGNEPLFEGSTPHRHSVKHSDRSKAIVEPYLSDQWYVRVTDRRLAACANAALTPEQRTSRTNLESLSGGTGVSPVSGARQTSDPYRRLASVSDNLNVHARNLPHFQIGGSTYFITFRVASGTLSAEERRIVLDACKHWHGVKMELRAATVMPDHVHLLLSPFEAEDGRWHSLSELMHSIKSFTSHQIGKIRGTMGQVWLDESFDRIVRDADEFQEKLAYIQKNPVMAGLAEQWSAYPFTWVSPFAHEARYEFVDRVRGRPHRRDACATESNDMGPCTGTSGVPDGGTGVSPVSHVGDGALRFYPARYAKTYEQWHDNIRDWCISRQLWWGHRIPVWSKVKSNDTLTEGASYIKSDSHAGMVRQLGFLDDKENEKIYIQPSADDSAAVQYWHVCVQPGQEHIEQKLASNGFTQDPDVLDTWFSSALWPLSTMGWPDAAQAAKETGLADMPSLLPAFNPTSTLCTAREIITLWVSRMVMFNRYLLGNDRGPGPVPFRHVYIHAVVQDGEGRKMSKSLGNGVDPLDIIATHGSDAMRFTLCQMATQTQDVRLPVKKDAQGRNTSEKFDLGRNFANKLWNAARFAMGILGTDAGTPTPAKATTLADRWLLSRLSTAVAACDDALAQYQFSNYAQIVYDLLWRDFCDWYLEAIKPTVATNASQRAVLRTAIEAIVRLLHPVMPFVTEAIYEKLSLIPLTPVEGVTLSPPTKGGLLATAGWPIMSETLGDPDAEANFNRLRELIDKVREVRAERKVTPKHKVVLHLPAGKDKPLGGEFGAGIATDEAVVLIQTLANVEAITTHAPAADAGPVATFMFEGAEHRVSKLVDPAAAAASGDAGDAKAAEVERMKKLIVGLQKEVATLQGRLANPGYTAKAPPHMVEETRQLLAKKEGDLAAAEAQLNAIG